MSCGLQIKLIQPMQNLHVVWFGIHYWWSHGQLPSLVTLAFVGRMELLQIFQNHMKCMLIICIWIGGKILTTRLRTFSFSNTISNSLIALFLHSLFSLINTFMFCNIVLCQIQLTIFCWLWEFRLLMVFFIVNIVRGEIVKAGIDLLGKTTLLTMILTLSKLSYICSQRFFKVKTQLITCHLNLRGFTLRYALYESLTLK